MSKLQHSARAAVLSRAAAFAFAGLSAPASRALLAPGVAAALLGACAAAALLGACAHGGGHEAGADPAPELAALPLAVDDHVLCNTPALEENAQRFAAALRRAFAAEGFRVFPRPAQPGDLLLKASVAYTPFEALHDQSLFFSAELSRDGERIDETFFQQLQEGLPETDAGFDLLAQRLARQIARSPRTLVYVRTHSH